jgi:hypothetical protein
MVDTVMDAKRARHFIATTALILFVPGGAASALAEAEAEAEAEAAAAPAQDRHADGGGDDRGGGQPARSGPRPEARTAIRSWRALPPP